MERLIIEKRDNSPKIILDPDHNILEISGESRPEDVRKFYEPVLKWVDKWGEELNKQTDFSKINEFVFMLDYFNSSSAKYIMNIIIKLNDIRNNNPNIKIEIIWKYEISDEDMLSAGQEFQNITKIPFKFVVIK